MHQPSELSQICGEPFFSFVSNLDRGKLRKAHHVLDRERTVSQKALPMIEIEFSDITRMQKEVNVVSRLDV